MRPSRAAAALLVAATVLVVAPATAWAATGQPSSGSEPVTAQERTRLERVAEAYAMAAHNDQRRAGRTRNGVTYDDVAAVGTMEAWTDVLTVARRWSDRSGMDDFAHNPRFGAQYGHWRWAGENIAATTMGPRGSSYTDAEIRDHTERLMQAWWESDGHRRNWMRPDNDDFAVGAAVLPYELCGEDGCHTYDQLMLTANFRERSGSIPSSWSSFPTDGRLPPDEAPSREPGPGEFHDTAGHLFEANVAALAQAGITTGCGGGSFCPDEPVTRGQMAAFLDRALGLPAGTVRFDDTRGHVFEDSIAALAREGITNGCGGGDFCPGQVVTRGQMAAFLDRALGLPVGTVRFDDTRGHVFENSIAALARRGITTGCGGGSFCPGEPVTRGQMAAFLDRAGLTS